MKGGEFSQKLRDLCAQPLPSHYVCHLFLPETGTLLSLRDISPNRGIT